MPVRRKAIYILTNEAGRFLGSFTTAEAAIREAQMHADQAGPTATFYVNKREAVVTRIVRPERTVEVTRYK